MRQLLPRRRGERRRVELLGGAAVGVFGVLIVCVFLLSSSQRFFLGSPQVAAVVSAVLVDLANGDRAQNNLSTLTVNPVLVAAAQAKANDMATHGYFAHISPAGVDPWHWFAEAGYTFAYAGENLAIDFSESGDVERAWMNSPTHRKNILDPHFTEIGIATAQGMYQGRLTTFVVQAFGAPARGKVAQEKVQTATVPSTPTQPAIASTQESTQVLGESAPQKPATSENPKGVAKAPLADIRTPESGAPVGALRSAPAWGYLAAFPKTTLRYVYYLIGFIILLALIFETGLELRWHHRKKAIRAGALLAAMCLLFVAADYLFFAEPVLAAPSAHETQAASASSAL